MVSRILNAVVAIAFMAGCQDPKVIAESGYTAELLNCVHKAQTKQESQECRRTVDAKWGVCDGGKC